MHVVSADDPGKWLYITGIRNRSIHPGGQLASTASRVIHNHSPKMVDLPGNQTFIYALYILLAAITLRLLTNRYTPGLREIPGPSIARYTRLWKLYSVWKGDHHRTEIALHKKYGPLVRIGPNHVSVSDPSAVSIIYGLNRGFTKVSLNST